MRKVVQFAVGVALTMLAAAVPADASIITYGTDGGYFLLSSPLGSPSAEEAWLAGITGDTVTYLQKYDKDSGFDSSTDPALGGSYFDIDKTSAESWDISWDLSGSGYGATYVLIKDGTVAMGSGHLYRLYQVTADQFLVGGGTVDFEPDYHKGISHVSFFGTAASVPDGGTTAALLGAALLGLVSLRRRYGF